MALQVQDVPTSTDLDRLIPRYAGFPRRTVSALTDLCFLLVIETFLFLAIGWEWLGAPPEERAWIPPLAVALGTPLLYDAALTASPLRGTLGKRLIGVYVCDLAGARLSLPRAALRHLLKYLSAATLGVGIFVQPFTYRKQALHDLLSRTVVRDR